MFEPATAARIVLATNVAETSLTVPGIRYVIDSGLARVKRYSYRNKVEQLQVEPISQAAANQRAGRCGRVANGICIRLYDEDDFAGRPALHRPRDPALVAGRRDPAHEGAAAWASVEDFPVPRAAAAQGHRRRLRAAGRTGRGRRAQRADADRPRAGALPLDPRVGRMILEARERESLDRSAGHRRGAERARTCATGRWSSAQAADEKHKPFDDEKSEFSGYLKLWQWIEDGRGARPRRARATAHKLTDRQQEQRLRDSFISPRRVREWRDIHSQLHTVVAEHGWRLNTRAGHLRAAAPGAAGRPARQHRPEERRRRLVPRRARHQVLAPPGRAPVQEAGALARGRRAGRDDAPVRPRPGGHRAAVDPAAWPATC